MPTVDVLDLQKQKVGSIDLAPAVFGAEPNLPLVHEAVKMQRASERQGTASTKSRGEVSGSGKKPWKQKHTGRARVGSKRSPLWRHGGIAFGPKPRQYGYAFPSKKYRAALRSALSAKLQAGEMVVVSDLALERPKTQLLAKALAGLGLTRKVLIVAGEGSQNLEVAARNHKDVKVIHPHQITVYDVVRYDSLLIPQREAQRLQELWS